jgi:hypothetical protein
LTFSSISLQNILWGFLGSVGLLLKDRFFFFFLHWRERERERERAKMANGVERESELVVVFSDEELREVSGVKRGLDYIEVTCGCTSHRYGDAVGRLRVFQNGELEITCECTPGCQEGLFLSLSLSLSLSLRLLLLFFGKWVLIFMHVGCMLCVCVYRGCGKLGFDVDVCRFLLFNLLRDMSLRRRRALRSFSFVFVLHSLSVCCFV